MNPSLKWDLVPVYGVYMVAPGDDPVQGRVEFQLSQRITRTDGRTIYPGGAKVGATIGVAAEQNPEVRSAVRAAWRAADEARLGAGFDGEVWDRWWGAKVLPAAIFTGFPAADDPDVVQRGWSVTVKEVLTGATGREYAIQPLLAHLDLPIPGVNLGTVEVPPGSPSVPAPVYAKGIAGGIAGLDADGDVVDAAGEKVTGSGDPEQIEQVVEAYWMANPPAPGAKGDRGEPGAPGAPGAPASNIIKSVNTKTGDVVLGKSDLGLGNVDNTKDADKPVSVAQAAVIAARLRTARWTGGAWEARPEGPFGVLFLSTNDPAATAPSVGVLSGDMWERHPDAV